MSAFVTLTHNDAKDWSDITPQARIIPNMLHRYPAEISPDKKTQKRIITAGRLVEQKGYDLLLDAWSKVHQKHPEWILDIYGEGEDKTMLLEKRKNLALENSVLFHPPTLDIYQKYMDSDFYVMSSRFEGFGIPIIEALYSGIPVVAATGSCLEEAGGPDSIYVHPDDINGMANAFKQIYSDTERKKEMIEKGQKFAKRFSEEKQAEEILNIYKKLMK